MASRVNSHDSCGSPAGTERAQAPCQEVMLFEHCWQRLQTPQLISDVLLVTWKAAFPSRKELFPGTRKGKDYLLI